MPSHFYMVNVLIMFLSASCSEIPYEVNMLKRWDAIVVVSRSGVLDSLIGDIAAQNKMRQSTTGQRGRQRPETGVTTRQLRLNREGNHHLQGKGRRRQLGWIKPSTEQEKSYSSERGSRDRISDRSMYLVARRGDKNVEDTIEGSLRKVASVASEYNRSRGDTTRCSICAGLRRREGQALNPHSLSKRRRIEPKVLRLRGGSTGDGGMPQSKEGSPISEKSAASTLETVSQEKDSIDEALPLIDETCEEGGVSNSCTSESGRNISELDLLGPTLGELENNYEGTGQDRDAQEHEVPSSISEVDRTKDVQLEHYVEPAIPAPILQPSTVVPSSRRGLTHAIRSINLASLKPKYVTVKCVYFLFYASLGVLMPFLPVYYHSLGISDRQIGHLGAITPAVTFLVSPLWGGLSDSTGRLKEILIFTFVISVFFRVLVVVRNSFAWIAFIIAITAAASAPVRPLLDSSVLNLLDDKKEYGKQRLWGQWGFGVGSFLVGPLISAGPSESQSALSKVAAGYGPAFLLHAVLSVPTLLILLHFKPKKEVKEAPKFSEGLKVLVCNRQAVVFFSLIFFIGISSGVIENFAYKRLRELGGSGNIMGVSRLVSSISGVPMFWFSGSLTKHVSIEAILLVSMASYIARFIIYGAVKNPWFALPAEALRGVTFAGMWAASTFHAHRIAPPGLGATMLSFLNGIYGGVGQSLGSLVGGALCGRFGTGKAFFMYAAFDCVVLASFILYFATDAAVKSTQQPAQSSTTQ